MGGLRERTWHLALFCTVFVFVLSCFCDVLSVGREGFEISCCYERRGCIALDRFRDVGQGWLRISATHLQVRKDEEDKVTMRERERDSVQQT